MSTTIAILQCTRHLVCLGGAVKGAKVTTGVGIHLWGRGGADDVMTISFHPTCEVTGVKRAFCTYECIYHLLVWRDGVSDFFCGLYNLDHMNFQRWKIIHTVSYQVMRISSFEVCVSCFLEFLTLVVCILAARSLFICL